MPPWGIQVRMVDEPDLIVKLYIQCESILGTVSQPRAGPIEI